MTHADRFAMRDLLIAPDYRFVVADKGSTWVTDRFVMVRGDLFKRLPKEQPIPGTSLPVSRLRAVLASARGEGKALAATGVRFASASGLRRGNEDKATVWRVGGAVIFLNERVTRTYYLAGLRPRYLPTSETVAWYGKKRGRDVLMVIQKPVTPFDLQYHELEAA